MGNQKVPLLLISAKSMERTGRHFKALGKALLKIKPNLGTVLTKIGIEIEPEAYIIGSGLSAFVYGFLFFGLSFIALSIRETQEPLRIGLAIGLGFWAIFFLLHIMYPSILLKKIAAKEGKDLLFALREMIVNADSGVPLFESMKNVGNGNYGYVSSDFKWAVKQIEGGVPEREALKRLALKSENEDMRRAVWQTLNALESGTSMGIALPAVVQTLESQVYRNIRDYTANLNFLMLIYMLAAAVLPSLGITFLVLLSAFSGLGVTIETIGILVGISAIIQLIMIGYMRTTRPEIFGG